MTNTVAQYIITTAAVIGGIATVTTIIAGTVAYFSKTRGQEGDKIDQETIQRLNNALSAVEKENEYLKRENEILNSRLKSLESQVATLTDLATNKTAINDVQLELKRFGVVFAAIEQFKTNDSQIISELTELRGMIREDRRTTQRIERRFIEKFGDGGIIIDEPLPEPKKQVKDKKGGKK